MSRQIPSSLGTCCCCCCKNVNIPRPSSRSTNYRECFPEGKNGYLRGSSSRGDRSCRNNGLYNQGYELDDDSWHALSSLRQKVCQLTRSDTDYTTSTDTPNNPEKQYTYSSRLQRANDLIDYAPQSEFLRKMKQQCKYLQNCQPNIFSTLDEFLNDSPSYECQKCAEISNPVNREVNNNVIKSSTGTQYQYDDDPRSVDDQVLSRNSKRGTRTRMSQAKKHLEEKKSKNEQKKVTEKKSEHISRSRKQVRCRGRRKRKTTSSEKCESENEFEPTLKKPHENSCERCWRYASPARSPVNKPDQRYDPNFRRGHSCLDFENADRDLEVYGVSPCRNIQVVINKDKEQAPPLPVHRPRAERNLEPSLQRPRSRSDLDPSSQRPRSRSNLDPSPERPRSRSSLDPSPERPRSRSNLDPSPERPRSRSSLDPSPQRPRSRSNLESYLQSRLEQPSQRPRIGNHLEHSFQRYQVGNHLDPPYQRSQFGSRLEVPLASKQRAPAAQFTPIPVITQKTPAALPTPSNSFTKVRGLTYEPPGQMNFDRSVPRAPTFEKSETNKTELPVSHRISCSESGRRPRPKSYTPGVSPRDTGIASSAIGDVNFRDYEDISTQRRYGFGSTDRTSKPLKTQTYEVPPNAGENFSDASRRSSPTSSRPCEHCSSQQDPEKKAEPLKEDKNNSPKVSVPAARPKTPKILIKTSPKAASAGAKVSPTKDSKSLQSSPPKRPATGFPKKGKSKSPSPKVYISKPEAEKSQKRSPQKHKSPKSSPSKTKSQHTVSKKAPAAGKKKPQSADPALSHNETSESESVQPFVNLPHPIRECRCYPRIAKPRENLEDQSGHIFCCHCDWEESLASQKRYSRKSPSGVQSNNENGQLTNETDETIYADIQTESNVNNQQTMRSCQCVRDSRRSESPENFRGEFPEKTLRCPYRHYMNMMGASPLKPQNTEENSRSWENEQQVPKERRFGSASLDPNPKEYSPRKYFVFYATKSKENRGKDNVEVLVEELAHGCPNAKDSRTKDITEKMRKILECPSDSLALRFQKGVSETCRTPCSSRILYF